MVDTLSKGGRSLRMSLIRGRDTKPELPLRKRVHALRYRFRVNVSELPGEPDLVFPNPF
jgi:DNA mismatch endonuclease (patch repair protein)